MTQNSAPTNLFSPEQMTEIQKSVQDRLVQDYRATNFIPVNDEASVRLFTDVITALYSGLTEHPQDALFFDTQLMGTIVQISAPTLFVAAGIAADADEACFASMQKYDLMNNALAAFIGQKYDVDQQGRPVAKPDSEAAIAAKAALVAAVAVYAESLTNVLSSLVQLYRKEETNGKYRESALVKHIFSEEPSVVDRTLYSDEFQKVSTALIQGSSICYTAPTRLGLDLLQVLAYLTDVAGGQIGEMQFAALVSKFGNTVINVDASGSIIVANTHDTEVRETLTPYRTWLKEFLYKEVANNGKIVPTEQGSGVICEVAASPDLQYPVRITETVSQGKMLSLCYVVGLATLTVHKFVTEGGPNELKGILLDMFQDMISKNEAVPTVEQCTVGNTIVNICKSEIDGLTMCQDTAKVPEALQYPAKIETLIDGSTSIAFRDLNTADELSEDTPEERTEVLLDVIVEFMELNSSATATNTMVPMPSLPFGDEVLVELPADRAALVHRFNARVQELAMEQHESETEKLFCYPAKVTDRGNGTSVVNFRDLPLVRKVEGAIECQGVVELEGGVNGASGILATILEQYMKNDWAIPAPSALVEGESLIPVPSSLSQSVQAYIANH